MNWFDLGLVLVVVVSFVSGVCRGLSRAGFGFLAVILAFLCAAWLSPSNVKWFVTTFVALTCGSVIAAFLLGKWFKISGLGWLDRLLGGAFGFGNGLLVSVLAVLALMAFTPRFFSAHISHSRLAPYAVDAAYAVTQAVPDEMRIRVEESYNEVLRVLPPKVRKAAPRLNEI